MHPAWHAAFDVLTPLCVKMDQWKGTRKMLAKQCCSPEWDGGWGGQWDRRRVGVNSNKESLVVPLYLLAHFPFFLLMLWLLLTKIDLGTFAHWWIFLFPLCCKVRYDKLPPGCGLALILWQKLSKHTVVWGPTCRVRTMYMGTRDKWRGILMLPKEYNRLK